MISKQKDGKNHHFSIIVLSQAVIYLSIWLWNEYVASYISLIFPSMILVILVLALIADWIEPSRIPRWYYILMLISIFIPVIIGAVFYFINDGNIAWLKG